MLTMLVAGSLPAAEPPRDLARRVAERETETEFHRAQFTYRETIVIDEVDSRGLVAGSYREAREVIFTPEGKRLEQAIGRASNLLHALHLTDEDFRDIRDVQPQLITRERLFLYDTKFRGEEEVDGIRCWLLEMKPRQILSGMRLFEGMLWIDPLDYSIVRSEGQAVPQIRTTKSENLFPHFTTLREKVDGRWFPAKTYADDTLSFKQGPQRIRMSIRYADYRRFTSQSTVTFGEAK